MNGYTPSTVLIIAICLALLLPSCEYNLDKTNDVQLDPPIENHTYELSILPQEDTIKIFETTTLNYNLDLKGRRLLKVEISFQDRTFERQTTSGSIELNPEQFDPGYDSLTLRVYVSSGTGSVLDALGGEAYQIEKKWLILLDGRPAPLIQPSWKINELGYLELSWSRCDHYYFLSYEVDGSINNKTLKMTVYNQDDTLVLDSTFIGGDFYFRVNCRTKKGYTWGTTFNKTIDPPNLYIEDLNWDSLRFTWDKCLFKSKHLIKINKDFHIIPAEDNSLTVPHLGFAEPTTFVLYTIPFSADSLDLSHAELSHVFYSLGTRLESNWPNYAYSYKDKLIYSNTYDAMHVFDAKTMIKKKEKIINNLIYSGLYTCPTNSSMIGATTMHNAYVFKDTSLTEPIIFNLESILIDHFKLTDDNKLAIVQKENYELYNVANKEKLFSLKIDDYPVSQQWASFSTSQNANHFCVVTKNGLKLYDISANSAQLIFTDKRRYNSCYFDPLHPDRLYVSTSNQTVEIRNPEDFSLTNIINLPDNTIIQNIDPESGYLLLTTIKELLIYDMENLELVYRIKCDDYKTYLYHNTLFSYNGYYLNISKKLKK